MRLAAKEKRGYVPLPPRTLELVEQRIAPASFDALIRLLDPCAGKGWALYDLTRRLRSMRSDNGSAPLVIPYAVEPDFARYDQCLDRFGRDYTFQASWEEMTVANHGFSLIYLNPPYDWEAVSRENEEGNEGTSSKKNRVEYNFLRETMQKLQPDGLLIFVLQHKILGTERVARTIAANFYDIRVYSLPDGEYEEYEQCVMFAYRRESIVDDNAGAKELMRWKTTRPPLLDDYDADGNDGKPYVYLVPPASLPQTKMVFRRTQLTYQETAALVYKEGASFTTDWQRLREPPPVNFQPVIRLRTGHIGPLISSGQLKTVNLGDMLVRGSASKEIVAQDEYGQLVDKDSPRCKTWTERFTTKIHCITDTAATRSSAAPTSCATCWRNTARCCMRSCRTATRPCTPAPRPRNGRYSAASCPKRRCPAARRQACSRRRSTSSPPSAECSS